VFDEVPGARRAENQSNIDWESIIHIVVERYRSHLASALLGYILDPSSFTKYHSTVDADAEAGQQVWHCIEILGETERNEHGSYDSRYVPGQIYKRSESKPT